MGDVGGVGIDDVIFDVLDRWDFGVGGVLWARGDGVSLGEDLDVRKTGTLAFCPILLDRMLGGDKSNDLHSIWRLCVVNVLGEVLVRVLASGFRIKASEIGLEGGAGGDECTVVGMGIETTG